MPDRPNVLFVLVDQMRASAMGCMGNDDVHTPTLDRMAEEGMLATHNYTPDPVCTPARASLLTGQYPHEHGVDGNSIQLPQTGETLGCVLRDAGYDTGYVGKWHLDGEDRPGYVPPGPRRQGFDYWKGFNRGHDHLRGHPHFDEEGTVEWEEGYQPEIQTDLTIDFLEEDREDPFFMLLSWGPPHLGNTMLDDGSRLELPFEPPEEYLGMYDREDLTLRPNVSDRLAPQARYDLAQYYGMITSLDDQLERLLSTLAEQGELEDTLVVFTADHGEQMGSQDRYYKGEPFEESVNVPLLARYPGEIPAGYRTDELVSLIDLMPTILSMCDTPVPDRVQGESQAPLFRDDPGATGREEVYIEHGGWRALRTQDRMLAVDEAGEPEYYFNMEIDPYQQHNITDLVHDRERIELRLRQAAQRYDDEALLSEVDPNALR
jgi:arylsulfatase A-like enzyme